MVRSLALSHDPLTGATTLSWIEPLDAGGALSALVYDTLRSSDPSDFQAGAFCLESDDGSDTNATELESPAVGQTFFYLTGGENACGRGPYGTRPGDVERTVRSCP